MIEYVRGNLLDADVQALVNAVNTVGVMGKGIALQFKERFPHNFMHYADACKKGAMRPGKMLVTWDSGVDGEKIVVNFPTKTHFRRKSEYDYIEEGLKDLVRVIHAWGIQSIALPALGCGNGGLQWEKVRPMIEQYLGDSAVRVEVYAPEGKR
jgi:O-acetyl-ADP-ribose deacetylase (regulator of RNase III)